MTDSPDCEPAEGGEVADLGGGQLRGGGEVEALQGGLGLEPGAADPAVQGHGLAAGDLVLAEDLEEVQVAEFAGVGLGEAGVEGGEHAGQLQFPQRGGERAAVGDGDGGHDGSSFADGGEDVHGVAGEGAAGVEPALGPAGPRVGGGLASGEGGEPGTDAARAAASPLASGPG